MDSNPSQTHRRKGKNPKRIPPTTESCPGARICGNSACRAVLSVFDTFCKRCSCCICKLFDDNKDPSLWLECKPNSPARSCGLSCHIECAIQQRKVGVVDICQMMRLDASYWCSSCGHITEILGCLMKQLTIAKDSRRVDILGYRIDLSFRLFNGTSRFQDLLEIIKEAKTMLETEVGPLGGVSAKLARGLVSRLCVAAQVQALCTAALQKADQPSTANLDGEGPDLSWFGQMVNPHTSKGMDSKVIIPDLNEDVTAALQQADGEGPDLSGLGQMVNPNTSKSGGEGPDLSGLGQMVNPDTSKADGSQSTSHGPDLNIVTVPDFAGDVALVNGSSKEKADLGCGGSENRAQQGPNVELPAVNFQASTEARGDLDENFEYCVKVIRGLECEKHITLEFRRKMLTWFGLRSTEQQREVVSTFIQIFGDDSSGLAAQLVDTFADIIDNSKRPRIE